jgi:hypothetical protein
MQQRIGEQLKILLPFITGLFEEKQQSNVACGAINLLINFKVIDSPI